MSTWTPVNFNPAPSETLIIFLPLVKCHTSGVTSIKYTELSSNLVHNNCILLGHSRTQAWEPEQHPRLYHRVKRPYFHTMGIADSPFYFSVPYFHSAVLPDGGYDNLICEDRDLNCWQEDANPSVSPMLYSPQLHVQFNIYGNDSNEKVKPPL